MPDAPVRRPVLALALLTALAACGAPGPLRVYIGTYTRGADNPSRGIYLTELDLDTGALTPPRLVAELDNPSFVAVHPSGRWLYSVNETQDFEGRRTGGVTAFAIDAAAGGLTRLNAVASRGAAPCHLRVDGSGTFVAVANYAGANAVVIALGKDGQLGALTADLRHAGQGVHPRRQQAPHPHSVDFAPGNRFLVVSDLGADRVFVHRFDPATGGLAASAFGAAVAPPGAGPRHFAFHPGGRLAYGINELTSTVSVYRFDDASGALTALQHVSTLPAGFAGDNTTAEIAVHPTGRFVYGSNRGHDSICVFRVDDGGRLAFVEHEPVGGRTPRSFALDPSGSFLLAAAQNSDAVVVFRIEATTGALHPTGHRIAVPRPVCLAFQEPR